MQIGWPSTANRFTAVEATVYSTSSFSIQLHFNMGITMNFQMKPPPLGIGTLLLSSALVVTGCAVPTPKTALSTSKSYPAIGPYSQMVAHGSVVYLSGVIPLNLAGNAVEGSTIEEQTQVVLERIGAQLASQGLSFDDVLSTTVFMQDLHEFAAMNRVYGTHFKNQPPARATVEVARLPRDVKIQIAVIAGRH